MLSFIIFRSANAPSTALPNTLNTALDTPSTSLDISATQCTVPSTEHVGSPAEDHAVTIRWIP